MRAGEFIEALDAQDTGAMVGLATVILKRHDKVVNPDDLWDSPIGSLLLEFVADDADPPTTSPVGDASNESASSSGSDSENDGG